MGWLANYWFFWYWWIIKDDLYSELDQLNKAYPSLGGETFQSYSGLRSFLGDAQVILWIENALEKKGHGWYHGACPYTACQFSMQLFSLLVLVKIIEIIACILKCCHIPWLMDVCWTARHGPRLPWGLILLEKHPWPPQGHCWTGWSSYLA